MKLTSLFRQVPGNAPSAETSFEEAYFIEGVPLSKALTLQPDMREEELLSRLSKQCGLPLLRRTEHPTEGYPLHAISIDFLKKQSILIAADSHGPVVIVNDPFDIGALQSVLRVIADQRRNDDGAAPPRLAIGLREEIAMTIEHLYPSQEEEAPEDAYQSATSLDTKELEKLESLAKEAGIVRKVDYLINQALDSRASDIHFEPLEDCLFVRCRIDGILKPLDRIPMAQQPAIISRIKLMASLDIAERRLPQDGSIAWKSLGRRVDIRVATSPTLFGESVVLRLLEKDQTAYHVDSLGLTEEQRSLFVGTLFKPHGMIFVTGPTGSGKTTTLYAALTELCDDSRKIITVEDPVEYQVPGVNQVQVNPRIGLTFASALRSFLRHDPDVLLVGEVRDQETARIAIESALTGHLVLSTLHTKDAPTAITRLRDLGVEPFLIADSLLLVAAQRLVRVLCPFCKTAIPITEGEKKSLAEILSLEQCPETLYAPAPEGCEHCGHTGWSGREGIFEFIPIGDALRSAITIGKDAGEIARIATRHAYAPMRAYGLRKALEGVTTLAEVLRVTSIE